MSGHDLTLLQMSNGPNDEKLHHEDVIHDVQFNWDGTLIATCSSGMIMLLQLLFL